ncbi:MAG: ABC transporter permease [Anaerolineales bacterium]|nr:ABC transporter permease [Anaerolineales bacterium]
MHLFVQIAKLAFQRQLTYRAAALAGLATNFFFGILRASVLVALFGPSQVVEGISVQGAITYTGLTQAIIAYLSFFGWWEVMDAVYSGDIGMALLKPLDTFNFWLAQDLGRALANLFMRGLSIMALYAILFDITTPTSGSQWLALVVALVLSWLVSFAWRFLINLGSFWTPNARGIGRFGFALTWALSGFIMPLRLFPDWFVRLCNLTPFPSMVNTVVEVYLGVLSGPELVHALLIQAFWFLVLVLLAKIILRAGVRHLVIQGG